MGGASERGGRRPGPRAVAAAGRPRRPDPRPDRLGAGPEQVAGSDRLLDHRGPARGDGLPRDRGVASGGRQRAAVREDGLDALLDSTEPVALGPARTRATARARLRGRSRAGMPSAGPPDRPTGRFGSKARLTWPLVLAGLALVALSGYRLAAPELSAVEAPSAGRVLPPPVTATASAPPATASPAPLLPPPVVADPVRLRIPAIAVDAPVVGLGLTPQGAIDVPTQWGDVGWYKPGVAPGAVGPAVLVGHYDSKKGPAVFYRLRSLLPGDQLTVVGVSGASVTFVVDRSETVSKAAFPTQRVYGPVTRPEIRLITCDGGFDERTHHYLDNLVVYGHAIPTPVVPPAQGLPAAPGATPAAVPTPVGVTPPVSPAGAQPTPSAGTPAGVASAAPVSAPPASAGSASAGLTPPPPASVAPAVPSAATPRPSG